MLERRGRLIQTPRPEQPFIYELLPATVGKPIYERYRRLTQSLNAYSRDMNALGEIGQIMDQHQKKDYIPSPDNRFVMSRVLPQGYNLEESNGSCYIDGNYGFAIGVKRKDFKKTLWLARTSFSPYDDSVQIVELQAYKNWNAERKLTQKAILDGHRWEFALVNLVALWAKQVQLPSLYIKPGEKNAHYIVLQERAKQRYDGTARTLGFKPVDGQFRLSLNEE